MQSKHVVFAALICIFCAGAVIAAITGQSGTISTTNSGQQYTLTPVTPTTTLQETAPPEVSTEDTISPPIDTSSTTSSTTQNDTSTSSTISE